MTLGRGGCGRSGWYTVVHFACPEVQLLLCSRQLFPCKMWAWHCPLFFFFFLREARNQSGFFLCWQQVQNFKKHCVGQTKHVYRLNSASVQPLNWRRGKGFTKCNSARACRPQAACVHRKRGRGIRHLFQGFSKTLPWKDQILLLVERSSGSESHHLVLRLLPGVKKQNDLTGFSRKIIGGVRYKWVRGICPPDPRGPVSPARKKGGGSLGAVLAISIYQVIQISSWSKICSGRTRGGL